MELYSLSTEDMIQNANGAKEVLLQALERDGVILNADELSKKYVIVFKPRGMFGKLWDAFTKSEKHDGHLVQCLKRV